MKQMIFNFGISIFCFPVFMLIIKTIADKDMSLSLGGIWIGICFACLINGFICLVKD